MAAPTPSTEATREALGSELLNWIQIARTTIDAHFPRETSAAHSTMVLETANALMIADRLGALETAMERLVRDLETGGDD